MRIPLLTSLLRKERWVVYFVLAKRKWVYVRFAEKDTTARYFSFPFKHEAVHAAEMLNLTMPEGVHVPGRYYYHEAYVEERNRKILLLLIGVPIRAFIYGISIYAIYVLASNGWYWPSAVILGLLVLREIQDKF